MWISFEVTIGRTVLILTLHRLRFLGAGVLPYGSAVPGGGPVMSEFRVTVQLSGEKIVAILAPPVFV